MARGWDTIRGRGVFILWEAAVEMFFVIPIMIVVIYVLSSIKILAEYERGVIFRLGHLLAQAKGPGVVLVFAPIDRIVRVSLRQEALEVPPQDIITRDNVTLKVNAVIFLRVIDPNKAVVEVSNYVCWRIARKSTCACKAFSTPTPRPGE